MRKITFKMAQLIVFLALIASTTAGTLSDSLKSKLNSGQSSDVILELPSIMPNVMSNPILNMLSGNSRLNLMTNLMQQMSSASQAPFTSILSRMGVQSEGFWAANKISMKNVDLPVINALQSIPGTFTLREPVQVKLVDRIEERSSILSEVQWNIKKVGADAVWSKTDGKGVLVANIDTGVEATHKDLKSNYAGQWFDAVDGKSSPWDDDGHGTHTMGTICGTGGIGVAPGARWVACRGLSGNGGSEKTLTACTQWIMKLKERPVVVSNSWGGGGGSTFFNQEIDSLQKMNIIPVFAIGNSGSRCSTAGSPGDQPKVISVGSTNNQDKMSTYSSRGPGARNRAMKPEVSAPGERIYSAWKDGGYKTISGTSMACPAVAGAVALMKAANPNLNFNDILKKLQDTASRPTVADADLRCGNVNRNSPYPNNAFGYGIINVAKAIN